MSSPGGLGENGWRLSRADVVGDGRGRLEPHREESVSRPLLGSCDLPLGAFHIKSLMCGLMDAGVKHELSSHFHLVNGRILQF